MRQITQSINYWVENIRANVRAYFPWLIALNVVWALSAWITDWDKILAVPWYVVPFMLICPIYPTLLAIWYGLKLYDLRVPEILTVFTFIGSASYGILALFFYPLLIAQTGFSWIALGSILWVMVYGVQSFILLPEIENVSLSALLFSGAYFLTKDVLDYTYETFSYLIPRDFSTGILFLLFMLAVNVHLFLVFFAGLREGSD